MTHDLSSLALEASGFFEQSERRDDKKTKFWKTKDGAPEWVSDLVYAAHAQGTILPDDFRYESIVRVLDELASRDELDSDKAHEDAHEIIDGLVDVYTVELTQWLSSATWRLEYVDDAVADLGDPANEFQRLQFGQYRELEEIYAAIVSALEERLEELGEQPDPDCPECGGKGYVKTASHTRRCVNCN